MNRSTEAESSNRRRVLLGLGGAGFAAAGVSCMLPGRIFAANHDHYHGHVLVSPATATVYQQSGNIFGVYADGSPAVTPDTDATTVINATIAAVAQQGGGSVFVASGVYQLSGALNVVSGIRLTGSTGLGSVDLSTAYGTVLVANAGFNGTAVVSLSEAFAAEIDHLFIEANSVANTGVVVAGRNCRLHDLVIHAATQTGIHITNGSQTTQDSYVAVNVINCVVDMALLPNTTGLVIDQTVTPGRVPTDLLIASNRIIHNTNYMIYCAPGSGGGSQFMGNHTTGGANGWQVTDGCMIVGNYFDSARMTSLILPGRAVTVIGNHFQLPASLTAPVIQIVTTTSGRKGLSISNNVTVGSSSATFVSDATGSAQNIVILGNVGTGIATVTDLPATGNYVQGNLFG